MKPGLRQSRSLGDRPINRSVKVVGRDERIAIPSQPRHLRREEEALFVHCSLLQFSQESKHPPPNAHAPGPSVLCCADLPRPFVGGVVSLNQRDSPAHNDLSGKPVNIRVLQGKHFSAAETCLPCSTRMLTGLPA